MSDQSSYRPDLESPDVEWIDDAFCIYKTRYGLYTSIRKDTKGDFLTGATYEGVCEMSRWHLMCEQEGTLEQYTRVVGNSFVGGKL